jgi:hypothetical protein
MAPIKRVKQARGGTENEKEDKRGNKQKQNESKVAGRFCPRKETSRGLKRVETLGGWKSSGSSSSSSSGSSSSRAKSRELAEERFVCSRDEHTLN